MEPSSGKIMIKIFLLLLLIGLVEVVILTFRAYNTGDNSVARNSKAVRNLNHANEEILQAKLDVINKTSLIPDTLPSSNVEVKRADKVIKLVQHKVGMSVERKLPINGSVMPPYWNMTDEQRQQFQQDQVERFCKLHGKVEDLSKLDRHVLLHDKAKTAFCFAPKVGCTNLKILFYLSQGALPNSLLFKQNEDVNNDILELAIRKHSFKGLPRLTKQRILHSYYKFTMYRNPVERLLSAYRSKIEKTPLQGFHNNYPHYNWLKRKIFQYKHPLEYKAWKAGRGKDKIPISFPDFVDFWLFTDGVKNDEHFQTIFTLCQPCFVRYHYYGNFDTFEHDAEVLIKHIESDSVLLRESYYRDGEQTSDIAYKYYSKLSTKKKKMIIIKLSKDLSFYYTIFPSQRDKHKAIMDIDFNIPPFN